MSDTPVSRRLQSVKHIIIVLSGKGGKVSFCQSESSLIDSDRGGQILSVNPVGTIALCKFPRCSSGNLGCGLDGSVDPADAWVGWTASTPIVIWVGASICRWVHRASRVYVRGFLVEA